VLWAVCAVGCLLLRPVWLSAAHVMPVCLWHQWTGIPCPGCGATRAIVHLLHGDASAGLAMNPLAALVAVSFVGAGLLAPLWVALGGRIPEVPSRTRPAWVAAVSAVVVANWAWLVASGV